MNKLFIPLLCSVLLFGQSHYYGSTTAAVTIAGAIVKSKHDHTIKKYNRKDCPVCKGKGWYMSGDNILKIECNYCEPDKGSILIGPIKSITPSQSPSINCNNGQCKPSSIIRR
jgi:hypothetical protein